jgi:hypothetical protein
LKRKINKALPAIPWRPCEARQPFASPSEGLEKSANSSSAEGVYLSLTLIGKDCGTPNTARA